MKALNDHLSLSNIIQNSITSQENYFAAIPLDHADKAMRCNICSQCGLKKS